MAVYHGVRKNTNMDVQIGSGVLIAVSAFPFAVEVIKATASVERN